MRLIESHKPAHKCRISCGDSVAEILQRTLLFDMHIKQMHLL